MLILRPVQRSDVTALQRLVALSPVGLASLPTECEALLDIIRVSEASFAADVSYNGEERYLFVLEDTERGCLLASSAWLATAGFSEPFYCFRNETFVHASRELNIHNKIHVLSLCHDLTGHSLLTGLHFAPEADEQAIALAIRGALLFVATYPERFAESLVADVAGYSDGAGHAPFWEAVGRYFLDLTYAEAERLSVLRGRNVLAELMPGYPVYVPLLPDDAQEVMGQVHPQAEILFSVLLREGFESDHYIDIFDGGPTVHARTRALFSVAHSQELTAVSTRGLSIESDEPRAFCVKERVGDDCSPGMP